MTALIIVMLSILAVFLAYTLIAPTVLGLPQFIGKFRLPCPVHRAYASIRLNPFGAALTSAYGEPRLRVRRCSLRGKGEQCGEDCLTELKS